MEQNATYNYLKHYQEELIKQYSQSLSLTQLTQLSQYFTQTQFANALAQSQFSNQFLTSGQNPLLSNANLLKQFMPSQLSEKSTSYGKKKSEVSITPNLTMESLKAFAALDPGSKSSGFTTKKVLPQTITSGSQATTITKVKSTVPSSMYNVNLPHALTNQQAPINLGNKAKTYPSKTETITHSVTSMSQVPVTCKAKPVYTPGSFKGIYTAGTSYGAADITKLSKSGTAVTKTTASSQIFKVCKNVKFQNGCRHFEMYYWLHNCSLFKEPMISKAHSNIHQKAMDKAANILMKDRPNISITPVLQGSIPLITTSSFVTPSQPSSGKTLQEKLADKQKQHSSKQLGRNIEAEIITTPVSASSIKKSLNIPSIPSSLTVSKASTYKFPMDSGISISQVIRF